MSVIKNLIKPGDVNSIKADIAVAGISYNGVIIKGNIIIIKGDISFNKKDGQNWIGFNSLLAILYTLIYKTINYHTWISH